MQGDIVPHPKQDQPTGEEPLLTLSGKPAEPSQPNTADVTPSPQPSPSVELNPQIDNSPNTAVPPTRPRPDIMPPPGASANNPVAAQTAPATQTDPKQPTPAAKPKKPKSKKPKAVIAIAIIIFLGISSGLVYREMDKETVAPQPVATQSQNLDSSTNVATPAPAATASKSELSQISKEIDTLPSDDSSESEMADQTLGL